MELCVCAYATYQHHCHFVIFMVPYVCVCVCVCVCLGQEELSPEAAEEAVWGVLKDVEGTGEELAAIVGGVGLGVCVCVRVCVSEGV